uniref:Uncharacterized protein n=1 Tax=Oryza rufipogon TaxID=4529 RepID=A0A0E0P7I6_ORYRU
MAVALVGEGDGGGCRWSGGQGVDTGGWGMEAAVAGSTYQNPVEAGSSSGCWVGVGRRRGRIREAGGAVDGGGRLSSSSQPPSKSSSSLSQLPPPWPLAPARLSPPPPLPRAETGRSAAARAAAASPPAGSGGGEGATASLPPPSVRPPDLADRRRSHHPPLPPTLPPSTAVAPPRRPPPPRLPSRASPLALAGSGGMAPLPLPGRRWRRRYMQRYGEREREVKRNGERERRQPYLFRVWAPPGEEISPPARLGKVGDGFEYI